MAAKIFISAREGCKLAGKIVSTKFIVDDIIHLKRKFIYRTVKNRSFWDSTFNLAHQIETVIEIQFWKNNIKKFNRRMINDCDVPSISITVYSDASSSGLASIFKDNGKDKIYHKFFLS